MFTSYTTVKIEKDGNFAKYVGIIRAYDNTLGMLQIKKAIDNGDVVFSFDPRNNPIIHNGKDNTDCFLHTYFAKTLKALAKAGAKLTVEDRYGIVEEFSYGYKRNTPKKKKNKKTSAAVMDAINARWKLPQNYLDYLANHAKSEEFEIGDEEFGYRIGIIMYGAEQLIEYQNGYSCDPDDGTPFPDWPVGYVVIADSEADPFCIDINREDSPIYSAEHGTGEWDFDEYRDSFEEFLEMLAGNEE